MQARDTQVFINCPFDARYKPIFDAIVFTLHDLGYVALHAFNKDGGGALRLPRIHRQLLDCAYSIHDISRVGLSGALRLPRFNMPFEAGIAYALHEIRPNNLSHNLLVLDEKPYRYQASVSDLAGLDPKVHKSEPLKAIDAVREFFVQHNPRTEFKQADFIKRRFSTFQSTSPMAARAEDHLSPGIGSTDDVYNGKSKFAPAAFNPSSSESTLPGPPTPPIARHG